MKIAIFTDYFLDTPGGVPSSITTQATELKNLGHEVEIFCPGRTVSKIPRDLNVHIVPSFKYIHPLHCPISKSWQAGAKTARMVFAKTGQPDLIHVNTELTTGLAGMRLAREIGVPLVITMHGREDIAMQNNFPLPNLTGTIANYLHGRVIPHKKTVQRDENLATTTARAKMWEMMVNHANFADQVISPSHQFAEKLQTYGVDKPLTVVSNALSDEQIAKLPHVDRSWKPNEPLRMIWTSRMSKEKRPLELIHALAQVNFPFRLDFYGEGTAQKSAKKLIKKLGLNDKIHVHNSVGHDEILRVTNKATLMPLMSYGFDTQSMSLLECLATGLPALMVDPDLREVLPRGGYVFPKTPDADAVADSLNDLAEHRENIAKMSQVLMKNREKALGSFQVKKLLACYEKTLKGGE